MLCAWSPWELVELGMLLGNVKRRGHACNAKEELVHLKEFHRGSLLLPAGSAGWQVPGQGRERASESLDPTVLRSGRALIRLKLATAMISTASKMTKSRRRRKYIEKVIM